jgi:hypothetical protein
MLSGMARRVGNDGICKCMVYVNGYACFECIFFVWKCL